MEALLSTQTTVFDKIVLPSWSLLLPQLTGGGYLPAVRSLSGESSRSEGPRPATEGRPVGGPQLARRCDHTVVVITGVDDLVTRDAST